MQEVFNTYFIYDEDSPTFLRWKIDKGTRKAGNIAGCPYQHNTKGERCCGSVGFHGKRYLLSRIIWMMFNGSIPTGLIIDHKDGNPWNNSLSNLACKERKHNNQNRKTKENDIGVPGVNFTKKGSYEYVTAAVYMNGRQVNKHFSITKLGTENAIRCAIDWRVEMMTKLVESGEMYTSRHLGEYVSKATEYKGVT